MINKGILVFFAFIISIMLIIQILDGINKNRNLDLLSLVAIFALTGTWWTIYKYYNKGKK
jgi:archaellum biogenesis protein FlaJ (TadC family)